MVRTLIIGPWGASDTLRAAALMRFQVNFIPCLKIFQVAFCILAWYQPILRLQLRLYTDAGGVGGHLRHGDRLYSYRVIHGDASHAGVSLALPGVMTSRPTAQKNGAVGDPAYLNMYPNMIRRRREEKMGMGRRVSCPHFVVRGHPKGKRRPPDGAQ